jgi:hypothetical protein
MRWLCAVLTAGALGAGVVVPAAAAGAQLPGAAKLQCSATVSNTRPEHGKTVDVRVKTAADAEVAAAAHFKTSRVREKTRADSAGRAKLAFKVGNAPYGVKVVVAITVSKGKRAGACSTSFTPTAPRRVYLVGSCRSSGEFAACSESGEATGPVTIQVHVDASPNQSVEVIWADTCTLGTSVASASGQFTATTPIDRTIRHPFKHPDSCGVATTGGLSNSGSLHVWTTYQK